jgi:hypothetical protein
VPEAPRLGAKGYLLLYSAIVDHTHTHEAVGHHDSSSSSQAAALASMEDELTLNLNFSDQSGGTQHPKLDWRERKKQVRAPADEVPLASVPDCDVSATAAHAGSLSALI